MIILTAFLFFIFRKVKFKSFWILFINIFIDNLIVNWDLDFYILLVEAYFATFYIRYYQRKYAITRLHILRIIYAIHQWWNSHYLLLIPWNRFKATSSSCLLFRCILKWVFSFQRQKISLNLSAYIYVL